MILDVPGRRSNFRAVSDILVQVQGKTFGAFGHVVQRGIDRHRLADVKCSKVDCNFADTNKIIGVGRNSGCADIHRRRSVRTCSCRTACNREIDLPPLGNCTGSIHGTRSHRIGVNLQRNVFYVGDRRSDTCRIGKLLVHIQAEGFGTFRQRIHQTLDRYRLARLVSCETDGSLANSLEIVVIGAPLCRTDIHSRAERQVTAVSHNRENDVLTFTDRSCCATRATSHSIVVNWVRNRGIG